MTEVRVKVCSGHTRPVCHIAYSGVIDGSYWFASSSHDSKPMLHNGETGDWVGTYSEHTGAVYSSCIHHDAEKIVTVSGDYTAKIWNCVDGSTINSWTHPHYVKCCDWMGDRIITGCFDQNLRIFDTVKYGSEPLLWKPFDSVCKAAYFTDESSIVAASNDLLTFWDLRSSVIHPVKTIQIENLNFVEYVRGYSKSIIAAHRGGVTLVDSEYFTQSQVIETADEVECACISPDGEKIAYGSGLMVKECNKFGEQKKLHYGHHGPVFHIRYSPTGESFTSGAEDGMIRIWPTFSLIPSVNDGN